MKTKLIVLALLTLAGTFLASCTTAPSTASVEARQAASSSDRRSYTEEELRKRGRQNAGEALEAQDASVQVSGRH